MSESAKERECAVDRERGRDREGDEEKGKRERELDTGKGAFTP